MMIQSILLIDDNDDDCRFFADTLKRLYPSIQLTRAEDGRHGLDTLKEMGTAPDLIFLDINMPRMNGWECLAELKGREDYAEIPVVMFTTSSFKAETEKARNLGAKLFVTKPFDYSGFKNVLEYVISQLNS
jgi:CheY-like chemotaxis protein